MGSNGKEAGATKLHGTALVGKGRSRTHRTVQPCWSCLIAASCRSGSSLTFVWTTTPVCSGRETTSTCCRCSASTPATTVPSFARRVESKVCGLSLLLLCLTDIRSTANGIAAGLVGALRALQAALRERGADLLIADGSPADVIPQLADTHAASIVIAEEEVEYRYGLWYLS